MGSERHYIAVISDTHDLLRDELIKELQGAELILHAGDVGGELVLDEIGLVAPVFAVMGNMDSYNLNLPVTRTEEFFGKRFHILHDLFNIDPLVLRKVDVVISGHTHNPRVYSDDGVLFINPGSAGPRRGSLPVCMLKLYIEDEKISYEQVFLG